MYAVQTRVSPIPTAQQTVRSTAHCQGEWMEQWRAQRCLQLHESAQMHMPAVKRTAKGADAAVCIAKGADAAVVCAAVP
eukprot:1161462-Pelagomonas_calceolata.AAC.4